MFRPQTSSGANIPNRVLLNYFAAFFLPIAVFFTWCVLLANQITDENRLAVIRNREEGYLDLYSQLIHKDFLEVTGNLRVTANTPFLKSLPPDFSPDQTDKIEKIFQQVSRQYARYDKIRYLRLDGSEVASVTLLNGVPVVVPRDQLHNRSGSPYFQAALRLGEGELYVSPLELNREDTSLEQPYKPTVRFATPVCDNGGKKVGIIVFNYLGDKILKPFQETMGHDRLKVGSLLNSDGFWLSGEKREDEWGFMLGKKELRFGVCFPEEWRTIMNDDRGYFTSSNGLFLFTTVRPLLPMAAPLPGGAASPPLLPRGEAEKYFWKIVLQIPNESLQATSFLRQPEGLALLLMIYLLLALATLFTAYAYLKRKENIRRLRETNGTLRSAEQIAHLGIWKWQISDNSLIWSEELFRVLGLPSSDQATLELFFSAIHPDDHDMVKGALDDALIDTAPLEQEFRVVWPDGEVRHTYCKGTVQRDIDGKPVSITGTLLDVTEKNRADQTLRQSEEQYRMLAENATDVVFRGNNQGELVWISSSVTALVGWQPQDLLHRPFTEFVHPDDLADICAAQRELSQAKAVVFDLRIRTRSGDYHWVSLSAKPILDDTGAVVARMGGWRDIQDEVEVRDALRRSRDAAETALLQRMQSETRFRTIFNQAPLGIALIDSLTGRIHEVNTRFAEIVGRTREEMIQREMVEIIHPDDLQEFSERMNLLNSGNIPGFQIDTQYILPDDSPVWIGMTFAPVEVEGGMTARYLCMIEDISPRKEYERYVEQAREAAESANRSKSEFLSNMSHEIRTPMNAVLGLAQLLEKEPLLPDQLYMVQRIRTAGDSLLGILNDILDISKIEAGQMRIVMRSFVLTPLLEQLDSLLGGTARCKGLTLRVDPPPELSGSLVGDELRLEQILSNLVGNAIKFTHQGEIHLGVDVVESSGMTVRLRFQIRDSGVGIAPEVIPTLFKPFTQADDSITRRFGGTGLGLSICKRLTELMGGTIGVQSREGEGSTFWFEIPFQRTPDVVAKRGVTSRELLHDGPRLAALRVLVVDDSEINRIVVTRALAREGAHCSTATDGQQAFDILRKAPRGFDIVLMDVQMPVMDGLTATRLLRREKGLAGLPVIAFTAGVLPDERQKALDAGVNDFLAKPVDLEEMVALLLRWGILPAAGGGIPSVMDSVPVLPVARDRESFLPEQLPGLDVARGMETLRGGVKFYREMIGELVRVHGDDASGIRIALEGGNSLQGARLAHTLKGVAGNLAAFTVHDIADELENALKGGAPLPVEPLLHRLAEALSELRASALLLSEEPSPPVQVVEGPLPDKDELQLLFQEFTLLLQKRQMAALKVMKRLEKYLSGTVVAPEVALLSVAVDRLEFDAAQAMATQLVRRIDELTSTVTEERSSP